MSKQRTARNKSLFERFATKVTLAAGSTAAFFGAVAVVVLWLVTGPIFHFSDTWQLVINTGTTIITFLMVFLIQKSQNKDALAIQLKLDELVAAHERASNRLVSVEDMSENELRVLQKYYARLASRALNENNLQSAHSIEETAKLKQDVKQELKPEVTREVKHEVKNEVNKQVSEEAGKKLDSDTGK